MERLFTTVVVAVIAVSSGVHAAAAANSKPEIRCGTKQSAKVELACGLRSFRSNRGAARWIRSHRTLAVVRLHQTPHSLPYYVWREKVSRRWIREAKHRLYRPRSVYVYQPGGSVQQVICQVFGAYCNQALVVSRCESGFSTTAVNGIYYGLFQMGEHERATYGNGTTALAETQAAYRYFVASGRDWSPWSCKP